MEVRRVRGSYLVKNCVYTIYGTDREDNYYDRGVYLVISEDDINNPEIRLQKFTWNVKS